ncbi:hypothetical protein ACXEGP_002436 [Klebsiella quasipneumoniae]
MTDITELTLREKFEAWLSPCWNMEKLIDDDGDEQYVERYVQGAWMGFSAANTELVEALEKAQQRIGKLEKKLTNHKRMNQEMAKAMLTPNDSDSAGMEIAALRQRIAELESFISQSCYVFDGCDSDISDAYIDASTSSLMPKVESEPCHHCSDGSYSGLPGGACEHCMGTGLDNPAAELESRTVTVKLPQWFVKDSIAVYDRDEIEDALAAAGIKVEAE